MAQISQSVFALGRLQTDYQTEQPIAAGSFRQLVKDGYDKPVFSSPNVPNSGQSTGSPYATKVSKDKDDVTFSGTERATFQSLGFHAVGAFGSYPASTSPAAGVYINIFSLLNPFVNDILPTRPLAAKVGEPAVSTNGVFDVRFPSMTYEKITFSSEGDNANLQISSDWRGSGKRVIPSGVQFYGTGKAVALEEELTENYIRKTAGVLTLNNAASLGGSNVLPGCDFRDVIITINENLNAAAGYNGCALFQDGNPDRGAIRGLMRSTGQTVEWSATLVLTPDIVNNFDPVGKLYSGAPFSASVKHSGGLIVTGHNHEATFTLNKATVASAELIDIDGGTQGLRIVAEPLAVGSVMPLVLTLKTNVANFNTLIGFAPS